MRNYLRALPPALVLALIPILYTTTLAQSLVLGDPTEYTFVANVLGIAHPPGYAFITLLGKLFQTLVPIGDIPWRMHLLSATVATAAALFVYGTVRTVGFYHVVPDDADRAGRALVEAAGLFAAFTVATAANFWQHAIHANPHIITATFLAANLFFLTRWWALRQADQPQRARRWLFAFSFSAGLGVTHHPLTVFAFPAYAIFILFVDIRILRQWRTLVAMVGFALLGLSLWLYFPIRSSMGPPFGPSTMNTVDGFLDHVLGRGITEALPYYSLREQTDRLRVFWSILRLQYAFPTIFLALLALGWPFLAAFIRRRRPQTPVLSAPNAPLLLFALGFLTTYVFVISLKAQDIMAYLLGPLLVIGVLAGLGLMALLAYARQGLRLEATPLALLTAALFLLGPAAQTVRNAGRISLSAYDEGSAYVQAVFTDFAGQNEGAVLLNDWEHMTPLWYTQLVEQRWPDPADVRPEYVSTARTWLENVFDFLPGGPVYLSNYRRDVVDAGFRLRPAGPFYQVVEPGTSLSRSLPADMTPLSLSFDGAEIGGYRLPQRTVAAGDYVPLALALSTPAGTADYFVPVVRVGELTFPFTTDSHLVSPSWEPGEIVVEAFDFALPHSLPAGEYPVSVTLKNLSTDTEAAETVSLGTLTVEEPPFIVPDDDLLANFRQRVGLTGATARLDGRRAAAPWSEPLVAHPGDTVSLVLDWKSLDYAEESYTVFVHLIDLANRPIVDDLDYTPLGGATPTHLWIPKWLPGQRFQDPYRLQIPPGLAPGTYLIEVGLYEMVGRRRLHLSDSQGNLVGDRFILGSVIVE